MKRIIAATALAAVGSLGLAAPALAGGYGKVWICHSPPGNPDAAHSIHVDAHGWNGHKNHKGDYEGKCKVTPTPEPTTVPTSEPTTAPTTEPTSEPTVEPSTEPTTQPTTQPTTVPTTEPTSEPTTEPTVTPTTEPTQEPSVEPTTEPTIEPSEPVTEPTTEPTEPVTVPTTEPTVIPAIGDYMAPIHRSPFPKADVSPTDVTDATTAPPTVKHLAATGAGDNELWRGLGFFLIVAGAAVLIVGRWDR